MEFLENTSISDHNHAYKVLHFHDDNICRCILCHVRNFYTDVLTTHFRLTTLGADLSRNDLPLSPIRQALFSFIMTIATKTHCWLLNYKIRANFLGPDEIDYSYYLGKNYRSETKNQNETHKNEKVSMLVSNHSSGFDVHVICTILKSKVAFIAGDHVTKMPGMYRLCKGN